MLRYVATVKAERYGDTMLISKKDLLAMTGISYGQLYRWKREGLIPDAWFIKQSAYTGQETFFPREQVISRIQSIQELKDKYSLEELARMFSPEVSERTFVQEDLEKVEEIDKELLEVFMNAFGKKDFLYTEIVFMVILSKLKEEFNFSKEQAGELLLSVKDNIAQLKTAGMTLAVLETAENYYTAIYPEQTVIYIDGRFDVVKEIPLEEAANKIKLAYQDKLNLM